MMNKTLLYQLTETSKFMMSFVLVTKNDNVIIVDGGREEDMPLLKKYVAGRHVSAWILTHAHGDHMWGFMSELKRNNLADFDVEKVIYNFPSYKELKGKTDVPDPVYFDVELEEVLADFVKYEHLLGDKAYEVKQGESIQIDECKIDFIYTYHDGLYANLMNDSSLVFRISTPDTSVLFLGDLGPAGGDVLFEESRRLLKSDIVQMAHHGHAGVGMEVYAEIMPKACLWCCADWLYNEAEMPPWIPDRKIAREKGRGRMYGTTVTRKWMDILGAKTHYVTKDGTNTIEL